MRVLNRHIDLASYFVSLGSAPQRVLMLDYDGTLAPFHQDPAKAYPYPEVLDRLEAIVQASHTRMIFVSGRPAQELLPFLKLSVRPEIWGTHGWERLLPDGTLQVRALAATEKNALQEAQRLSADALALGARIEQKTASLALHWRGLQPTIVKRLEQWVALRWVPLTRDGELGMLPFDGGIELRSRHCSKAHAVQEVLSELPSGSALAYLGDDNTDEEAFRALKARGLGVLVRDQLRQTAADLWIRPPAELLAFLERWQQSG